MRHPTDSWKIATDDSVEFDVRMIGFKLARACWRCIGDDAPFSPVSFGDRELRWRARRGREGKGRYSLFYKSRPRGAQKRRNRRRMTKVTARCQNTCPFLFLRSERPAVRAPLCISMHRLGAARRGGRSSYALAPRVRVPRRVAPRRETRACRAVVAARVVQFTRGANDGTNITNAGLRQMIYRACRSAASISRGRDLPANCSPFFKTSGLRVLVVSRAVRKENKFEV